MARRRDIIVAIVIALIFFGAVSLLGIFFIGFITGDGEVGFVGLGEAVGIVEIFGSISESSGRPIIDQLDRWAESGSVGAIVIHVNSPGGGVAISQEIYDAVRRASERKPVVAAMASVAASGGYYVACAADRIIANPGTLTGSIGVLFEFHTAEGLLKKVGIGTETVKSGDLKDVGTYARPMTKKEELMLRSVVMDTYEQFVEVVAEGRGMDVEEVYPLADGSIFTGLQALNLGLVDTLGGLNEAIDLAAVLADLDGDPRVLQQRTRRRVGLLDLLGGVVRAVEGAVDRESTGPQLLYLYR